MSDNREEMMRTALMEGLAPEHLEIIDESSQHAGHAEAGAANQTHFKIIIVSECFTGVSLIKRQRMVYACLEGSFQAGLHAVSMTTKTPLEYTVLC